ncbi:methyltransferase domain-containing protein [Allosphingosinicella sp.]|uniref:methyltransferase domain-containing protein n=1 Tax=Allosphingosinicella sp. TaxID=2823234 RepID=UPI002EF83315
MSDRDYVLGTEADEIERLGVQHRVWRPRMLEGWTRSGIGPGDTVVDVGAGPGYASVDLAQVVGPSGRVIAVERSRRFLESLRDRAASLDLGNIEAIEHDVSELPFGEAIADFAWCRWLISFVADRPRTVRHIAAALKPGGVATFHEYADYGAWQMIPPDPDIGRFRDLVVRSWREAGGEPDVGLTLPVWLAEAGLEIVEARPMIQIARRGDPIWEWPAAFVATNARRLRELGYVGEEEAEQLAGALDRAAPGALMITPLVVEIVARKPSGGG